MTPKMSDHPAVRLLTARAEVALPDIPAVIPGLFDRVYGWLARTGAAAGGHNHAVYRFGDGAMVMWAGVPFDGPVDAPGLEVFEIPAGPAAHLRHTGPYSGLAQAHTDLHTWLSSQPVAVAGLAWEVYGDWSDDPAQLITDVFVAVQPGGPS